ncbi:MAG: helix-turn-helix domain-containing protein [Solirubrobacteraceae bacterium]
MPTVERAGPRARVEAELAELVAAGASHHELIAAMEAAMECRLWVTNGDGEPCEELLGHVIMPGTEVLGCLQSDIPLAAATAELSECLHYGARVIGIELVRERAARETRWSFEADLLTELIDAGDEIPGAPRAAREPRRVRPRSRMAPAPARDPRRPSSPSSSPLLVARRSRVSTQSCLIGGRLAVAVCDHPSEVCDVKLRDLHRVARGLGCAPRIGVSSPVANFARGIRQAEAALRLARCAANAGTMYHEDLGSLRFLLNAPNETELMSLVEAQVGPLAAYDRERQTYLLQTLQVFLDVGGNRRLAAERCHVHESTIKYRMQRIRELLGCDLTNADVRFDLMLALKVLALLRAVDADSMARIG